MKKTNIHLMLVLEEKKKNTVELPLPPPHKHTQYNKLACVPFFLFIYLQLTLDEFISVNVVQKMENNTSRGVSATSSMQ